MSTITTILSFLVQFTGKLTGGYSVKYLKHQSIDDKSKDGVIRVHGITSMILAFGITNNYLTDFHLFKERFAISNLWIVGTAFILLVIFLILISSILTFVGDKWK